MWQAVKHYFIGTFPHFAGAYIRFPYLEVNNRITRGKLIRFNPASGRRLKGQFDTSSLSAILKLKENFQYKQALFGEHLIRDTEKPLAIVEAEKTAVIASMCLPEFIWLACGSKQNLKADKLTRFGERQIILYPDADGFELWQKEAEEAVRRYCLDVKISSLIQTLATPEQKAAGFDPADYLIDQQQEINELNIFIDNFNAEN